MSVKGNEFIEMTEKLVVSCYYDVRSQRFKGAGSRNVNKLLSKRRFLSIFDRPCLSVFPLLFSNESVILKMVSIISIIYIVAHTWPLCAAHILVDGVNPQ